MRKQNYCLCKILFPDYSKPLQVQFMCVVTIFGVKVNLVCSKTKVAPMKDLPISLLGLMSFLTKSLQSVMNGFIF